MTLLLDLPPELAANLTTEAARCGLPLPSYVLGLLTSGFRKPAPPQSGAELVAYWQRAGLVGTRPDITDTDTHARNLRQQAECRNRP